MLYFQYETRYRGLAITRSSRCQVIGSFSSKYGEIYCRGSLGRPSNVPKHPRIYGTGRSNSRWSSPLNVWDRHRIERKGGGGGGGGGGLGESTKFHQVPQQMAWHIIRVLYAWRIARHLFWFSLAYSTMNLTQYTLRSVYTLPETVASLER